MREDEPVPAFGDGAEQTDSERETALHRVERALRDRPADPDLLRERARLLVSMERFREAERDAESGLRQIPDDPDFLLFHGSALVARAEFRGALVDFERLRALLPDNANLHVNCAEMSLWLSEYDTARVDFSQALQLDPANVAAHFGMARVSALQRRCGESREWLRRMVALHDPAAGRLLLEIDEDSCFRHCRTPAPR